MGSLESIYLAFGCHLYVFCAFVEKKNHVMENSMENSNTTSDNSIAEINRVGNVVMYSVAGLCGVLILSLLVRCALVLIGAALALKQHVRSDRSVWRQLVFLS